MAREVSPKHEQPTEEARGIPLLDSAEGTEEGPEVTLPPSPVEIRRSTRSTRGKRDLGCVLNHSESQKGLVGNVLSHWEGSQVLHVSLDDTGRTEESCAATAQLESEVRVSSTSRRGWSGRLSIYSPYCS